MSVIIVECALALFSSENILKLQAPPALKYTLFLKLFFSFFLTVSNVAVVVLNLHTVMLIFLFFFKVGCLLDIIFNYTS